jgi:hypothetical protein
MALSVKASLGKVSRDLFSADLMKAMSAAVSTDVGAIEVTLRDLGLVDLLAADQGAGAGRRARPAGGGLDQ